MNIIKLKDIQGSEYFNESLKGRYAFLVRGVYVYPMDGVPRGITVDDYWRMERDLTPEDIERGTDVNTLSDYVDHVRTSSLNDISLFQSANNLVFNELTISELKVFRGWLADALSKNTTYVEHYDKSGRLEVMLNYYAHDMLDDTLKNLSQFSSTQVAQLITHSSCGCSSNTVVGTNGTYTNLCDPVMIYRQGIYNYMTTVFSDIEYWSNQIDVVSHMIPYIEGILRADLPLTSITINEKYIDCTCTNIDYNEQSRMRDILKRLIQALEYIRDDKISGNKNYITSALSDWSRYLYEHMYWM